MKGNLCSKNGVTNPQSTCFGCAYACACGSNNTTKACNAKISEEELKQKRALAEIKSMDKVDSLVNILCNLDIKQSFARMTAGTMEFNPAK